MRASGDGGSRRLFDCRSSLVSSSFAVATKDTVPVAVGEPSDARRAAEVGPHFAGALEGAGCGLRLLDGESIRLL